MWRLYKDPNGEKMFESDASIVGVKLHKTGAMSVVTNEDKIASLQGRIKNLSDLLKHYIERQPH